jgi:hypothetical protein
MTPHLCDQKTTRDAILGKLLRKGDLGYLREGEVFWVGRARERSTIRGKKLDRSDLERPRLVPRGGTQAPRDPVKR